MMRCFIIILIAFFIPFIASGQAFHVLITNDTILKTLCTKLSQYDSVLAYNVSSFWNASPTLQGIAYQGGKPYRLCIQFSVPFTVENNKHPYFVEDAFKVIETEKIWETKLEKIENDSLNVFHCSANPITSHSSDGEYATLIKLYPKNQNHQHRQAYMPSIYQRFCPNTDRDMFLSLLNSLLKHFPHNGTCQTK